MNKNIIVRHLTVSAVLLLLCSQMFAGSYTIQFYFNAGQSTSLADRTFLCSEIVSSDASFLDGNVQSPVNIKVYGTGYDPGYIQIGKSGTAGSLSLNLSDKGQVKATSIVVKALSYNNSNFATLKVNGQECDSKAKLCYSWTDYTYTVSPSTLITSLTLESDMYCYVQSITINYEGNVNSVTVGELGYATLYVDHEVTIPSGLEAFYVTADGSNAYLHKIEGVIPAFTGVVVKAAKGTYSLAESSTSAASLTGNLLIGYGHDVAITGDGSTSYYALNYKSVEGVKQLAFFAPNGAASPTSDFTAAANKAYLRVPEGGAAAIALRFGDETGVDELQAATTHEIYDLMGRRVESATKGIYIIDGKKVMIR